MVTTPSPQNQFRVRQMTVDDFPAVIQLQLNAFPGKPPWLPGQLERHFRIFPEGQLVVSGPSGRILGSASSLIIDWDDYAESANWSAITGRGTFDTHNPIGLTLYGAEIGVDASARHQGIGTMLYEARKDLIRERGLKRLLTGGRIAGYDEVADQLTPKEYVAEVVAGKRWDPALTFQLENGLVVLDANVLLNPDPPNTCTTQNRAASPPCSNGSTPNTPLPSASRPVSSTPRSNRPLPRPCAVRLAPAASASPPSSTCFVPLPPLTTS